MWKTRGKDYKLIYGKYKFIYVALYFVYYSIVKGSLKKKTEAGEALFISLLNHKQCAPQSFTSQYHD